MPVAASMDQCECHAHARVTDLIKTQVEAKQRYSLQRTAYFLLLNLLHTAPFAHLTSVCTMYTKREIRAKLQNTHAGTPVAQLRSTFTASARDGTFPPPPRRAETLDGRASGVLV